MKRKEDIEKVFDKIKEIEEKMNSFMKELSDLWYIINYSFLNEINQINQLLLPSLLLLKSAIDKEGQSLECSLRYVYNSLFYFLIYIISCSNI